MRLFLYYKFNVIIFYSIKLDIVIFILNRERTFIKNKNKKGSLLDRNWGVVSHGIGGFLFSRLVRNLHLSSGKL